VGRLMFPCCVLRKLALYAILGALMRAGLLVWTKEEG
jgi:hypothetical protein